MRDVLSDTNNATIARSITGLAHSPGLTVLADPDELQLPTFVGRLNRRLIVEPRGKPLQAIEVDLLRGNDANVTWVTCRTDSDPDTRTGWCGFFLWCAELQGKTRTVRMSEARPVT